jgi:hypothetical protein
MAAHPPAGTVTLLLTDHALANVDPKFLTGHITVGMESIADA